MHVTVYMCDHCRAELPHCWPLELLVPNAEATRASNRDSVQFCSLKCLKEFVGQMHEADADA